MSSNKNAHLTYHPFTFALVCVKRLEVMAPYPKPLAIKNAYGVIARERFELSSRGIFGILAVCLQSPIFKSLALLCLTAMRC